MTNKKMTNEKTFHVVFRARCDPDNTDLQNLDGVLNFFNHRVKGARFTSTEHAEIIIKEIVEITLQNITIRNV